MVEIIPVQSVADGIEASRNIISKCWFDEAKCEKGINALINYSKDFDEKNKVFRTSPKHDWASHGADGFRQLAVSFQDFRPVVERKPRKTRKYGV